MKTYNVATLNFHHDPGHGWIEAPKAFLRALGILHKVSTCSYQNDEYVFLEEDCDAALLINELDRRGLPRPEFRDVVHADFEVFARKVGAK